MTKCDSKCLRANMKANSGTNGATKVRADNACRCSKRPVDRDFAKNPTLLKMTNISDWGGGGITAERVNMTKCDSKRLRANMRPTR